MRGAVYAIVFFLVAVYLAGCIGGDDDVEVENGENGDGNDGPSETTGSIQGRVVRAEEITPIANAEVKLYRNGQLVAETIPNENGNYQINGINPGEYRLQVTAPCCRGFVEIVDIRAGETTERDIPLEVVRTARPFVDRDGEWEGFIACGVMYPSAFTPISCSQDPNHDDRHIAPVDVGLKTIVVAVHWQEEGVNLFNNLRNYLYLGETGAALDGEIIGRAQGEPSLAYRVDADPESSTLNWDSWDSPKEIGFRVWVGSGNNTSTNVVYQQPFTVYYHLFYHEPAPEDYSALPDI